MNVVIKPSKYYAVVGKPILHSLSPAIMQSALCASKQRGNYFRLVSASAKEALLLAKKLNLKGLNVTAPFKLEFAELADVVSTEVDALGAANTVTFGEDGATVYNTDIAGVRNSLLDVETTLTGKQAVVLGAGGAARAACFALKEGGASVTVTNRTFNKARLLAEELQIRACPLIELKDLLKKAAILVSCVSSTEEIIPKGYLSSKLTVLDAIYKERSSLVENALEVGAKVIPGENWLLHQALEACKIFDLSDISLATLRSGLDKTTHSKRILLSGLMGAGKSTVAKLVAKSLGWSFLDLDMVIEEMSGKSIPQIFSDNGESSFREAENKALEKALEREDIILSIGGGALLSQRNREICKAKALNVWLWASANEAFNRISHSSSRPLLPKSLPEFEEMLEKRFDSYAESADLVLDTDSQDPQYIANELINEIRSAGLC
jgi:shikimate dehydrogenase